MTPALRRPFRSVGRRVLDNPRVLRTTLSVVAPPMMKRAVEQWPPWAGFACGVRVPRSVTPNPEPNPSGGAHPTILLELLDRTAGVSGDVVECGVYRGETLLLMAIALCQRKSVKQIVGIDTFEGFGDEIRFDIALGGHPSGERAVGAFADTSYDELRTRIRSLGLEQSVELHRAYFKDAFEMLGDRAYSFVHLDCDIYSSYSEALSYFYPRVSPGGIVLLDEYNDPPWPGCNLAVDEVLDGKSERLQLIERGNFQKWFLQKDGLG